MIDASEIIPFGEWMPDLGNFNNPGALTVKNCIPQKDRYIPFNEFQNFSDALSDVCKGAFAYRDAVGNVTIFAATKTKIYKLSDTTWSDVTRTSGGDYTTGDDGFWQFVNYGNLVIGTNYNDDIQAFDISSDTNFSQLSSTAPRCRMLFVLKNFLVCLDVVDGDGATAYRVRWSPLANPEGDWSDVTLQADFQDIYGGDFSNSAGISIQDVGYIIQEKNIFRMEYVGGTDIFRFERVEDARGSNFPRGVITNGRNIYYPSEDGFYEFNGVSSTPIGDGKIDKHFLSSLDATYYYNLNTAIDPINKLVLFAYPSTQADAGIPDKILCFNWVDRRWTTVDQETQILFRYLSVGYTLEGLDNISASLDALTFSLDSRNWNGGQSIFGAFNGDNILGSFSGTPKTATFGSAEVRPNSSGNTSMNGIIPYVEGSGTVTARLGTRKTLSESITWTPFISKNQYTDEFDFTSDFRMARAEFQVSGDWKTAIGFSLRAEASGAV